MARNPRVHFSGALYHAMSRGNQGHSIFKDDRHRERYLELLKASQERFDYRLYAYVLMGNHLIEIGQTRLSAVRVTGGRRTASRETERNCPGAAGDGLGGQRVGRVYQSRAGQGVEARASGVEQRFREADERVRERSGAARGSENAVRRFAEGATAKKIKKLDPNHNHYALHRRPGFFTAR